LCEKIAIGIGYDIQVPGTRECKKIQEPGARLLEPDCSITTTITITTTNSDAGGAQEPGPRNLDPEL
jgi:hypothetical protein